MLCAVLLGPRPSTAGRLQRERRVVPVAVADLAGSRAAGPTGGPGRPAGTEQLTGLCRAYLAKPAGQRDRALATAAFASNSAII